MARDIELSELIQSCEKEEIRFTGAIQSFGVFLALDSQHNILAVSENIDKIDLDIESMAQRDFFLLLPALAACRSKLSEAKLYVPMELGEFTSHQQSWTVVGLDHGAGYFIEFEPAQEKARAEPIAFEASVDFTVHQRSQLSDLYPRLLASLQKIMGFDHIMVYQFLADFTGEVVAERQQTQGPTYLGHRFPASDIPKIARDLYCKTLCRIVGMVGQGTIAIRSFIKQPIDLTHCYLRSVSPMHLEYLQNMGVVSSFSIPILVDNQLWGLVACHHYDSKILAVARRMQAVELVQKFAVGVRTLEIFAENGWRLSTELKLRALDGEWGWRHRKLEMSARAVREVTTLLDLCGFALFYEGQLWMFGQCPPTPITNQAHALFSRDASVTLLATECCQADLPALIAWPETLGGMVLLQKNFLVEEGRWESAFLGFRAEITQSIKWAGPPEKTAGLTDDGTLRLRPRHSFKTWIEETKGHSKAWSKLDKFKVRFILDYVLSHMAKPAEG